MRFPSSRLRARPFVGALACFVAMAAPAAAQTGTGRLSGLVKDASGGLVPGATVIAVHEPTGVRHQTVTTGSGQFVFPSLPVGPYTVTGTLSGFKTRTITGNELSVGADLSLTLVLEPGNLQETVTVAAETPLVQTTESSISTLVSEKAIVTLPLNGRNPLHLIGLVPGVAGHSSEATSSSGTATHYINGDRGRGITTTQDGIDISDPVIPRGELTNAPVNPEALQEFRVITSNPKAEYGRSAGGQVELVTKSGTNEVRGTLYEFLRNTALDANSYFNEQQGIPKEVLRRNQFGLSLGGPIRRDKAFFFVNYEGQRRTQETSNVVTVPTDALRRGQFRFVTQPCAGQTTAQNRPSCVDAQGKPMTPISTYDLAANDPRGIGLDPAIQNQTLKFLPLPNDFTVGDGLNTAGYRWNSPTYAPVDTVTARVDVNLSSRHSLFARTNIAFRNHLINDIINTTPRPLSWPARERLSKQQGGALGLKSNFGPHLLNEVTVGFTRNRLDFIDPEHPRTYEICSSGCIFTSPFVYWPGTARTPIETQLSDNVTYVRGSHAFKAGVVARAYFIDQMRGAGNPFGIYPSFTFSRTDAAFSGLDSLAVLRPDGTRINLTGSGINSTDRNNLNTFYNVMLGRIGRVDQTFYSDGTGFVALQPLRMKQRLQEYNGFLQDDWRLTPRLTLNLGLRYELNTVPYDTAGVQVAPDKPLDGSQGPVSFDPAGPGTGRSWFRMDKNNFAPVLGFSWDPFGGGHTAVRGSYRIAYQRLVSWALNVVEQRQPATSLNQFLTAPRDPSIPGTDTIVRLDELLRGIRRPQPQGGVSIGLDGGIPHLSTPTSILRTPPNNRGERPLFFQEHLQTPFVHQWTLGFQRELWKNTAIEMNYVGSRGVHLFRMLNVNQMDLVANGFLKDFRAAQRNLAANQNPNSGESTGTLGTLFGGNIPSSVWADIQNGNVGLIADALDRGTLGIGLARAGLADTFFRPNPQFTVAGLGCSCSSSWYNSLQVQMQHRARGLTLAANYTLAKSIDDLSNDTRGAGTEIIVSSDPRNPQRDKGRSDFDVRHVFRGFVIWDVPVGRDRRFLSKSSGLVDLLLGGWQINGILDASSGFPFSVYSGRNTFTFYDSGTRIASTSASAVTNRAVFTGPSTHIGRARRTERGVEWFSTEERALFQTPDPGEIGSERNLFTGPRFFQFDLGLFKNFKVSGERRFELRLEVFNVFNTVNFDQPNVLMTSGGFGTINDTRVPPRIVQLGLKFYF
jgi:hypothetical protein